MGVGRWDFEETGPPFPNWETVVGEVIQMAADELRDGQAKKVTVSVRIHRPDEAEAS